MKSQSGLIQFILLFLMLVGLAVGVYLVQKSQVFKSRADNPVFTFKYSDGSRPLPKEGETPVTDNPQIKIQLDPPPAP